MSSATGTFVVKKRERTQNWVPEEKIALLTLIKDHVNAIENKKIDAAASAMKSLAWHKIYCAFRGKFSTERDITRIREQWRRMKAQARIEIYTFVEKVRTLGLEEASKNQPSKLSIEVWRLLQNTKKNDCDTERSDESSLDADGTSNIDAILDKLPGVTQPEVLNNPQIKTERSDSFVDETETGSNGNKVKKSSKFRNKKRNSNLPDNDELPMDLVDQKRSRIESSDDRNCHSDDNEHIEDNGDSEEEIYTTEPEISVHHAQWIYEAGQKEHELKIRMLNIDLERAELQKQTAINELTASEIKKQLIESQAAEYYSQIRMTGERGSGAGRGGGGGGAIRDAGGSFGKMEAAHEDQYFYNQQKEQIQHLREGLHDEISFHEEQIKRHQEAIKRHKERIGQMEKN